MKRNIVARLVVTTLAAAAIMFGVGPVIDLATPDHAPKVEAAAQAATYGADAVDSARRASTGASLTSRVQCSDGKLSAYSSGVTRYAWTVCGSGKKIVAVQVPSALSVKVRTANQTTTCINTGGGWAKTPYVSAGFIASYSQYGCK